MFLFASLSLSAGVALFQAPVRQVVLSAPERSLAETFSQVRGIRELRDGRIIIADRLDRGLLVADFASGAVRRIGRNGQGPLEYTLISGLVPLRGDTTLAIDEGNSRLVLIAPDTRILRTFVLLLPGLGTPVGTRGVDLQGRYYSRIPAWMFQGPGSPRGRDTIPIVRFDAVRGRVDTIAHTRGMTGRPPKERRVPGIPYVIYAPEDIWGVAPDGRIAVVRSGDYHVEWIAGDGRVTRGPAVPFTPLRVTAADRFAYTKEFMENSSTSGRDPTGGGGLTANEPMSREQLQLISDNNDWAEVRPPFTDRAPFIGSDGTLWVERSRPRGTPEQWDLFDGAGRLTVQVTLPAGRRLGGLGVGQVYLILTDEDGLQRVERYRMP